MVVIEQLEEADNDSEDYTEVIGKTSTVVAERIDTPANITSKNVEDMLQTPCRSLSTGIP